MNETQHTSGLGGTWTGDEIIRMTTGEAIVRFIAAQYSSRDGNELPLVAGLLGILGHGNAAGVGFGAAMNPSFRFIQGKNEQAMVHTAIGYARAQRLLSTMAVSTSIGPGATNLVTGAATATVNRTPVLLLPGDVFSNRRQGPVLQQLEHPLSFDMSVNDALRPVSVFFDRIMRPSQVVESLAYAVQALLRPGESGAVTLAIAQDVQGEAFDFPASMFDKRVHVIERTAVPASALDRAVGVIAAANRPLVISGGGVKYSEAEQAVVSFANRFGIPVVETHAGRGTARGATIHAGGVGFVGSSVANHLARDSDVVICVGTRLLDTVTASRSLFQERDVKFINVNASARDAHKMGGLSLIGDAKAVVEDLQSRLSSSGWHTPDTYSLEAQEGIGSWRRSVTTELKNRHATGLTVSGLVDELNHSSRSSDRVVLASSSAISDVHSLWDVNAGGSLSLEYGYSCMGHEIPGALGERLALGGGAEVGQVYAVVGDGSYLMGNTAELVTARQENADITVIVLVNDGYQCIREFQENALGFEFGTQFRSRMEDDGYVGPVTAVDYAKNAESFGCLAFDVRDRQELQKALEKASQNSGPALIAAHVSLDTFAIGPDAWWDYGAPEEPHDPRTKERTDGYVSARSRQRWMP